MTDKTFYTRNPIIKQDILPLYDRVLVGGTLMRMLPFEKKIYWILEAESHVVFVHNDKVLKDGGTYIETYGFLKSTKSAIEAAKELIKVYDINDNSTLSVEVRTYIYHKPALKYANSEDYAFEPIPNDTFWFESDAPASEYEQMMNDKSSSLETRFAAYEAISPYRIERRKVEQNVLVWSSAKTEEFSVQRIEALRRQHDLQS